MESILENYPLAVVYDWTCPLDQGLLYMFPPQFRYKDSGEIDRVVEKRYGIEAIDPISLSEQGLNRVRSRYRPYWERTQKARREEYIQ